MSNLLKSIKAKFGRNKKFDPILKEIEAFYNEIKADAGGGCSVQKALVMAEYIKKLNLKVSADIGVYRGRSLFPQAIAHKLYTNGVVYGVDPYSNEAAVQHDRPDLKQWLSEFAETTNFEEIYLDVLQVIQKRDLQKNCKLIREKSGDACHFFKENNIEIELVHIDGNHDTYFVMNDVRTYLPLLANKAIVVLDDISWDSVKPAIHEIEKEMTFIGSLVNRINDFSVYSKGLNNEEAKSLKALFKDISNVG